MGDFTEATAPRPGLAPGLFGVSITASRPTDDPLETTRRSYVFSAGSRSCPRLSVVIPVPNEPACPPGPRRRLTLAMPATGRCGEAWLVDDGSRDDSQALVRGYRLLRL